MKRIETKFAGIVGALITAVAANLLIPPASSASPAAGKTGAARELTRKQGGESPRAKPFCSWSHEFFKDQVGEVCRKDLLGRIKDPQDKIFVERIFKNWVPLKGYEIIREPELFQIRDEKTNDSLQFVWFSRDPWVALIDGVIVTDHSKDTSIFRRIERMLKRAEEDRVAFGLKPLNPIQLFLFSNEAYAVSSGHRISAPAFFTIGDSERDEDDEIYTRQRSGSAEQIFSREKGDENSKLWGNASNLKKEGYLPDAGRAGFLWSGRAINDLNCRDNGTIEQHDMKLSSGKTVKVRARNDHTFLVIGYPKDDVSLVVNMKPDIGVAEKADYKRRVYKHGKPAFRKNKRGKWVPWYEGSVPCNGRYSRALNSRCATVWQDMREEKTADGELRFPEVDHYFADRNGDEDGIENIRYGSNNNSDGLRCSSLFRGNGKKLNACLRYFSENFPNARRHFEEGQAHYTVCPKDDTLNCAKKETNSRDLAMMDDENKYSESEGNGAAFDARRAYRREIKRDPGIASKLKTDQALNELCPLPNSRNADVSGECRRPPRGASEETREAWDIAKEGDEDIYKNERGEEFTREIERRLLGEMMMGECCRTESCRKVLKENYNIDLKGGKMKKVE